MKECVRYERWIHQERVLQREWRKWTEQMKREESLAHFTGIADVTSKS